ncbi:hypothetical protein ACFLYL_04980, partial [Chloroflexota bacterium]
MLPFLGRGHIHGWMQYMISARIWSTLDGIVSGVKGVWCPPEFHRTTIVISIEQKHGGHAKQAALAALGQYGYNIKYIIMVDDDIDPFNIREVTFALAFRADPEKFDIIKETWCDSLTPTLSPLQRQDDNIESV